MYRLICLFLFLNLTFTTVLLAQNKNIALDKLSYDELKKGFFDNQKSKNNQVKYAKAYLTKAKKDNENIQIARSYYLFSLLTDSNQSISYLDSVIKYSKFNIEDNFPAKGYLDKGFKLRKKLKFKEAIDNFLLAENVSKSQNNKLYYDAHFYIGVIKAEDLGDLDEGMIHYRNCYNFFKTQNFNNIKYSNAYLNSVFAMADIFKAKKNVDSATYYNRIGYNVSNKINNEEFKNIFILNEGANLVVNKDFKIALDSIKIAKPFILKYNDGINPLATFYYMGKSYAGLKNKTEATKNFIKVDSIYNITKNITPEFTSGYHYLINHYKATGNREKQLLYITKLMTIDSTLTKNYKELTKKLQKDYDVPHLMADKQTLINSLQKNTFRYQWVVGLLGILASCLIAFSYYQRELKKSYKIRFDALLSSKPEIINSSLEVQTEDNPKIKTETKINEGVVSKILLQLEKLESDCLFLKSDITTQSLAEEIGTNNKYISTIVNEYKNKKFTDYLNDLRVNYAIETLKTDTQKRKYTIDALSKEFGFNNAESFSNAFQKRTGLKPSYFIKELDKI